ncbi:NfeD family protein [Methanospirillum sp. J.3.6.1-F.2.7.3]|jgi:membrane protein implicated in regulation of membrane protease activity|uniref:NfeD family protein n=2 Tax=Methanospirillum TaxID=2202 RepID=A0A8E7B2S4_9EURY|nr:MULTISPECIES: NfeD family protein [Methanospirillum]MDX8549969.1 NfeD family protein [Methanospirillum hungatei]QVV90098.1 NfeD family protein [Methanospirillum sp. J.3.6.1-F.2.7.3]QXO94497.1 NfeD family protein [Methanospirillum hungatei]
MVFEDFSYGWIIILFGALFFVLEVFSPGFFLLVPGTVLLIIGVLVVLGIDIFGSTYGIVIGIAIAILAAIVTVFLYSRLTPGDEKPLTISMDSLIGKTGRVLTAADEQTLSGKVSIEGQIFSAKSYAGTIPEGAKVKVIASQGVHIVVEEE